MTNTQINIKGEVRQASDLQLPASGRKYREFWVLNGDTIEVDWDAALQSAREKATITRRDFALAAATEGWITEEEALAWAGGTQIPAWVTALIDNGIPQEHRLRMKLEVLSNDEFTRLGALMPLLQAEVNTTDEKIDQIYGIDVS